MKTKIRVAVVMGGQSPEHDVSMRSGAGVLAHLNPDKYDGLRVAIGKDGLWSIGDSQPVDILAALSALRGQVDVAFLALHGPFGEDGTIQAVLDSIHLPYTGSGKLASALAMHKARAKDIYAAAGLMVSPSLELLRSDPPAIRESVLLEFAATHGVPVVVKTPSSGSSVGVEIARSKADLIKVVGKLLEESNEVMVEKFVRGREVTSPILENAYRSETMTLPLIEIRPRVSSWFDYRAKYEKGGSMEICPAPLNDELTTRCQAAGLTAHRALGCRGMSRTDMIIEDGTGDIYILETNTIPGFTETSLLPQAAQVAGISYTELVNILIFDAMHP